MNQPSRNELDQLVRRTLIEVRMTLDNVTELRDFLYTLGVNDAGISTALQADPYNYTAGEASAILNSVNSLNQLKLVATGQATQGAPSDFFFFPKIIWGVNLSRR